MSFFHISFHISMVRKKKKGFTLMEILVVVSIMAILSAIMVIPNINAVKTIRTTVDNENEKTLEMAFEQYYLDNDKFPDGTVAGAFVDNDGANPFLPIKNGKYLSTIPKIQSKKSSGAYKWCITSVNNTEGKIEIDLQ